MTIESDERDKMCGVEVAIRFSLQYYKTKYNFILFCT